MPIDEQDEVEHYLHERRTSLKRTVKQLREEAGYSKQTLAHLLGCARSKVIDVEKEDSTSEYSLQEIEILAVLCGKHPLEIVRLTGQEAIALSGIVTTKQTGPALLDLVDCQLPERMSKLSTDSDYFPPPIVFSTDGTALAIIASSGDAEQWEDSHDFDDPYQYTLAIWDARSGQCIAERSMPYVEHIAFVNATHLAIATSRPLHEIHDARDYEGEYSLLIWNVRDDTIEQTIKLLDRVDDLAASPDGTYLAAFFSTTTTIQIWQATKWTPIHAFELETLKGDLDSIGSLYRATVEVRKLPRERKFGRWIMDYSATRFKFMNNDVLVIGFGDKMREFSMQHRDGYYDSPIEHPHIPWTAITHVRDENGEIAVTEINHTHHLEESEVKLYYLEPRKNKFPPDTYIELVRMFSGSVYHPLIVDTRCILALIDFPTPYRWGMFHKQRTAVCNLITGRLVMLSDAGRLRDGDDLSMPRLSPSGSSVGYWVLPYEKEAPSRLVVQSIDTTLLCIKGKTLEKELDQQRRRRAQNPEEW